MVTLICLACIFAESVVTWKYPRSISPFGNFLVIGWILCGWFAAFRYRKKAHELFREQNRCELAIERTETAIGPNSVLDSALPAANRAIDTVLLLTSLAILVLLGQILFILSRT
jgi:hypothetical protein